MTREELDTKLNDLKRMYEGKVNDLKIKYARENQKFVLGDILECDLGIIKVEKTYVCMEGVYSNETEIVYRGKKLKKSSLEPYKNGEIADFYESRIERKIACV